MGRASILGEIGAHALNMIAFVTREVPSSLLASMTTLTEGREVVDDAQILLEFSRNRLGRMWLSFVAAGNEHGLSFLSGCMGTKALLNGIKNAGTTFTNPSWRVPARGHSGPS